MGRASIRELLKGKFLSKAVIIICAVTLVYNLFMIGSAFYYSLRSNNIMESLQDRQYAVRSFHKVSFDSMLNAAGGMVKAGSAGLTGPV
ncbi:MAG TPA: hypothetical protein PK127_03420 [Clostridiales bacterium]|nr:hypothetical protein [Clostridiales bacterium]HPV01517.1 hypothetical protein [Clostridiales bacterium]